MAERCTALTFLFEGEVLCEVPALVVPTQEEECGGVVDLERPEVENTLGGQSETDRESVRWGEEQEKSKVCKDLESTSSESACVIGIQLPEIYSHIRRTECDRASLIYLLVYM